MGWGAGPGGTRRLLLSGGGDDRGGGEGIGKTRELAEGARDGAEKEKGKERKGIGEA
jgi:hypothetical protein